MANPKVFEFAKEIGMETLALMAKIREWQLPIKSHMAELTPDLVEQINVRLNPPKESASAAKKTATKKKAPVVAKKTTVVTVAETPATSEAAASAAAAAGHGPLKVVRRKAAAIAAEAEVKKSETHEEHEEALEIESEVKETKKTAAVHAEEQDHVESKEVKHKEPKVVKKSAAKEVHAEEEVLVEAKVSPTQAPAHAPVEEHKAEVIAEKISEKVKSHAKPSTVTGETSRVAAEEPAAVIAKTAATPASTAVATAPQPQQQAHHVPGKGHGEKGEKKPMTATSQHTHARKKEVVVGQSGFASSQKPANEVVRKNIVGRMDLSRVAPPPGSFQRGDRGGDDRGSGGFGGPRGGGGMGSQRPTPSRSGGGLRTGFIAAATTPPPMLPDDIAGAHHKSKFDDRNKKFSKSQQGTEMGGGSATPEDEAVMEFNSAEFRKREMVFQPKKKKGLLNRESLKTQITVPKASKRILKVESNMKLSDAANTMGVKAAQITKVLLQNGVMANMSTVLDFDTLALIAPEFGWEAQNVFRTADEILEDTAFGNVAAAPIPRPPVVTVMGHVDHGKTSLLDAIRKTDVAAGEAGGITQHIGAYQVKLENGQLVTFLDTPGHEAFTSMRARGANATDIAVIVVAADDGVMPQTAEAINHAKAAGVPIVIAINKIDKPGANVDKIKQQLTEYEIVPEEWGGSNIFCEVSAIKKIGIKELLEQLLLVAEMQELKANPDRSATGIVIESSLEKGRGCVATLLVKDGTIHIGDLIVAGTTSGRVRSLMNDKGERVEKATPGQPVELLGLDEAPQAGDKFDVVKDEKTLERVLEVRRDQKMKAQNPSSKLSLEELFSKVKEGEQKTLNIILKSDVMGSAEAIQGMFQKLNTQEVKLKVVHAAVGGITEGDILLATTSKAVVIGFNTRPDTNAQSLAKRHGVEIRTYSIVYELVDDLKRLMSGLLEPEIIEQVHGRAEVRNTFTVPKIGTIAGSAVVDGKIARSHLVRLIRDGVVVYQGKIGSLKRFKDDAKEVATGYECGIGIENFNDVKVGDVIEAYSREEVRRQLTELQPSV